MFSRSGEVVGIIILPISEESQEEMDGDLDLARAKSPTSPTCSASASTTCWAWSSRLMRWSRPRSGPVSTPRPSRPVKSPGAKPPANADRDDDASDEQNGKTRDAKPAKGHETSPTRNRDKDDKEKPADKEDDK